MNQADKKKLLQWWQKGLTYAEQNLILNLTGLGRPEPPPLPPLPTPKKRYVVETDKNVVVFDDNANVLPWLPDETFDFVYIDPPYNTGNKRLGYHDARAKGEWLDLIYTRTALAYPKLKDRAVFAVSMDDKNSHWACSAVEKVFGRDNFISSLPRKKSTGANDTKTGFVCQHDILLLFAKDKSQVVFYETLDSCEFTNNRYMNSAGTKETKGWFDDLFLYPKPVALLEKLISVFCPPDGKVLDFFAGSGTTGHAVLKLNRETWARRTFTMILLDEPQAVKACKIRMQKAVGMYGGEVTYVE